MNAKVGIMLWGMAVMAGCSTSPGEVQTSSPAPVEEAADETTSIWDGVYTDDQATRGLAVAQAACLSCHSANEWSTPMFLTVWSGRPVVDLYENLRMTMPYDAPGRLTREEYAEVVAYMLSLNGAPSGDADLPSDPEELGEIILSPSADE